MLANHVEYVFLIIFLNYETRYQFGQIYQIISNYTDKISFKHASDTILAPSSGGGQKMQQVELLNASGWANIKF